MALGTIPLATHAKALPVIVPTLRPVPPSPGHGRTRVSPPSRLALSGCSRQWRTHEPPLRLPPLSPVRPPLPGSLGPSPPYLALPQVHGCRGGGIPVRYTAGGDIVTERI